jgi:hypothetical protein
MSGYHQIKRTPNMRSASTADLPAALAHVRTPGLISLTRDVRKLVSLIATVITRRRDLPIKPQLPK